ncbi:uncharacterized protein A4U43_C07F17770 [Asparagus officinalis]|uniref:Uncharacterized protein n=1 Tax=Asparagus officinalis TaxID=4686 RepID=A0A5P1EFS8_ASPOF|nr:uncharacterized protein A4U43_C07F17770 [Asparagus officinalis]
MPSHPEVARLWPSHSGLCVRLSVVSVLSGSRLGSKSALMSEFESVIWSDDSLTPWTVGLIPHASGFIPSFTCGSTDS